MNLSELIFSLVDCRKGELSLPSIFLSSVAETLNPKGTMGLLDVEEGHELAF